jgi:hypothetical protein
VDKSVNGTNERRAGSTAVVPFMEPMKLEERIRAVTAEKPYADVVVKSKYVGMRADQLRDVIVNDYNHNPNLTEARDPIIVEAGARPVSVSTPAVSSWRTATASARCVPAPAIALCCS